MRSFSQITNCLRNFYDDPHLHASFSSVAGGDIHQSFMVEVVSGSDAPSNLFIKLNSVDYSQVLAAEKQALDFFQASDVADLYPKPILFDDGVANKQLSSILAMEYHELASLSFDNASALGKALAKQHLIQGDQFGWEADNFIGTTLQRNQRMDSWCVFFAEQRLAPQLNLASQQGLSSRVASRVQRLIGNLEVYFDANAVSKITPCLLHGDLWVGNLSLTRSNSASPNLASVNVGPLLYDPAPYFGDPEVDIAMTQLFGRLPESFYQAYHAIHPLRSGHDKRAKIYDLYHMLNHFNLFGAGYESAIWTILNDLRH